jgi:hypothetical protein
MNGLTTHESSSLRTTNNALESLTTEQSTESGQFSVIISGIDMSTNPCAGVGTARAIRTGLPQVCIIGIDSKSASGLSDPVFDRVKVITVLGSTLTESNGANEEQVTAVLKLLQETPRSFFIPVNLMCSY